MSSSRVRVKAVRTRYIVGKSTCSREDMRRSYVAAADPVNAARLNWVGGARGWARMERMAGPPSTRALTVGDLMSRSVLTTEVGASVAEAAALMFARRVGSVVVVEG